MKAFLEVFGERHDLVQERGRAREEMNYDDPVAEALAVEEREFMLDLLTAYRDELRALRAQWRLPRGELKAALHRAFAAIEADDAGALGDALLEAANLLGGRR